MSKSPLRAVVSADLIHRFAQIVGDQYAITDPDDMAPHMREWRDRYIGKSPLVLKPGSVAEVSRIMALAQETGCPVVPQGGNTGLVGGQIPFEQGTEIVLSLTRLSKIRAIDPDGNTLSVDAGVTLQACQDAADSVERLFPLSLGSEGTCQIGGNLATNAGGTAVLAYGNTRDLALGLEVVLANGEVWDGMRGLRKDNTGYALKHLFIGSEGTLGIITGAVMKLFPKPKSLETAFVGLESPAHALQVLNQLQSAFGTSLTSFEIMPRIGIEFCLKHMAGVRDPLEAIHPWYVLLEVSSGESEGRARETLEGCLMAALDNGSILDAALAQSEDQRKAFWHVRTGLSEVQKHEGGSIKTDVAVPIKHVPAFLEEGLTRITAMMPDSRPVPYGHLGDGNIHFNLSQPVGGDKAAFIAEWENVTDAIHEIVMAYGGSISAEHGIGRMKHHEMSKIKSPVELALMRQIKNTFDPKGILNPGKVV